VGKTLSLDERIDFAGSTFQSIPSSGSLYFIPLSEFLKIPEAISLKAIIKKY